MEDKKKSVLFLLHLPPPVHGSSIVGAMIKNSVAINNSFRCSFVNLLASDNVAASGKVSLKKLLGFVDTFFKVFGQLSKQKPQLCYFALTATGAAFFKDALLVFLLKMFRVKIAFHMHNKGVSNHGHQFLYKICYRYVFDNSDVIILSRHLYKDIQTFVPLDKVHICANGIPDTLGDGNAQEEQRQGDRFKILFLSNLIESKGVYVLLEACSILKEKGLLFNCTLIGGEGDITKDALEKKISALGLAEMARYEGKKYGEEKIRYFKEASVFVFPTFYRNECFPLVLLEAKSFGLPLISTFEGGIPDIVDDGATGFLVVQKNVKELADRIEMLINNPGLAKKMGEAGRKKYEQQFTVDIFEKTMIGILGSCL